jgi:hypothetical protein
MLSLVYVSSAVRLLSTTELMELLHECRLNNAQLGITGLLLYKDGNFMQVLEGEDEVVRAVAAAIERDPRHKAFTILTVDTITERQFGDWSMAFNDLDRSEPIDVPGYSDFLNQRLPSEVFTESSEGARALLMTFREHN